MPRRNSSPSTLTAMVSTTSTEPSVRSVVLVVKERISSRAVAGSARAKTDARASSATAIQVWVRRVIMLALAMGRLVLELHLGYGAVGGVFHLEELHLLELEEVGDDVRGEGF